MNNMDIRTAAKEAGVKLWQVAEGFGVSDNKFSRMMRHELPQETKTKIFDIIAELSKEG